jgi:predicted nuclease of predicted toxin-antitoxin system
MRFLIDMNLSPGWVDYLTRAGHHAEHWSTIGPGEAPDDELLAYAARHELVILTQDLDFGTLLARDGLTTSVIQFRTQAVLPDDLGPALLAAIDAAQPHLDTGALVTIDPTRHRLTLLPIRPE